jgi:hypothetical protein
MAVSQGNAVTPVGVCEALLERRSVEGLSLRRSQSPGRGTSGWERPLDQTQGVWPHRLSSLE